ncbi:bifunctional dihydroneopterin aldolase/7,8-dihydroneopterin epimerase, partial [Klebsiella quasipneumoniae]
RRVRQQTQELILRAANVGVIIERGLNLKQNFSGHTC